MLYWISVLLTMLIGACNPSLWVVAMGGCYGWLLIGARNPSLCPIRGCKASFSAVIGLIESVSVLPNGPNTRKLNGTIA